MADEESPHAPPSASAFLQKHTHLAEDGHEETTSSAVPATEMVSNLIEGLVRGSSSNSNGDDEMSESMKHRKEAGSLPYDQRVPKMVEDENGKPVPYKGFNGRAPAAAQGAPAKPGPFAGLRHRFQGLFSPRATDIQQLLIKLQTQFDMLEVDHRKYCLVKDSSSWHEEERRYVKHTHNSKDDLKDPKHPLNNPKLMTEVHFVGRKAIDPSVIQLTSLLATGDRFGSITELWLNDNLITDEGAAAIASFLQLPTCALVELWLGNNQIGPSGVTLMSAALSNNETSKLKCLGLYKNPIGNGGATSLAQMLRKNHTLSTVDIHGCGSRGRGPEVLEGYGCKIVKGSDGTEYVARVVATSTEEEQGVVTDQRLLDAIQTFVAFNRINPTREQAIRGLMSSNNQGVEEDTAADKGESTKTSVADFLSELSSQPGNEKLSNAEKRTWKTCEWERLYLQLQRAREAKKILQSQLKDASGNDDNDGGEEEGGRVDQEGENTRRDLDDEVVRTDARSWRELKMGITGSVGPSSRQRKAPPANGGRSLYSISDDDDQQQEDGQRSPPQSAFPVDATAKAAKDREELEKALETVVSVEEGVKTPEEGKDDQDYKF